MVPNEYTQELIAPDKFVLPRSDYHRLYVHRQYVKQSKTKHVIFALFVVAVLVAASIFLSL